MTSYEPTERTRVRRLPARGRYDAETVHAILDEGLVCHIAFVHDGQPFVLPTSYARRGDRLYLHGAPASRMLGRMAEGLPVCVTVTLLDGLVLARSAFHHSMNYRSVVILGTAIDVTDPAEKRQALDAFVDHIVPGRLDSLRRPSAGEVAGTRVLAVPLAEASAKVRTGPPLDDEEDYAVPAWAGELPLVLTPGTPIADPRLAADKPIPDHVRGYRRG